MPQETSAWSTIGKIAAVASIVGFLAQIGVLPFLEFVTTPVSVPAWTLVTAIGLSLWLLPLAIGRAVEVATKDLSRRAETANSRIRELEVDNHRLGSTVSTVEELRAEVARVTAELRTANQELATLKSLDNEIVGLLRSGGEFSLFDIAQGTSAGSLAEGQQRVQRAIANLGEMVQGTGSKYRLRRDRSGA